MSSTLLLADTHCHLQDPKIAARADRAVAEAAEAGVRFLLVCGYDEASSVGAIRLAERHETVYAAVGVHPHDARSFTSDTLRLLEELAAHPKCVAIGEIGLDFYRNLSRRPEQERALEAQLELAATLGLPVSVHSRAAEREILAPLSRYAAAANALRAQERPVGVMHCFGGTLEEARPYVEIGFVISIACPITYPKNERTRRLARPLPLEALVVETDAPYLPPQEQRGQVNTPANVRRAAEEIARVRGVSFADVARVTTDTAMRVFALRAGVGSR